MLSGEGTRRSFLLGAGAAAPIGLLATAWRITPASAATSPAVRYAALLEALASHPGSGVPAASVRSEAARFGRSLASRDPAERAGIEAMLGSLEDGTLGAPFTDASVRRRLELLRRSASGDRDDGSAAANVRALVEFARAPFCEGTFLPGLTFEQAI